MDGRKEVFNRASSELATGSEWAGTYRTKSTLQSKALTLSVLSLIKLTRTLELDERVEFRRVRTG